MYEINRITTNPSQKKWAPHKIVVDLSLEDEIFNGYNPNEVYFISTAGEIKGDKLVFDASDPITEFDVYGYVLGKLDPIGSLHFSAPPIYARDTDITIGVVGSGGVNFGFYMQAKTQFPVGYFREYGMYLNFPASIGTTYWNGTWVVDSHPALGANIIYVERTTTPLASNIIVPGTYTMDFYTVDSGPYIASHANFTVSNTGIAITNVYPQPMTGRKG